MEKKHNVYSVDIGESHLTIQAIDENHARERALKLCPGCIVKGVSKLPDELGAIAGLFD